MGWHSYSVSPAVVGIADMDLALAPALVHTYSVELADTAVHSAVDSLANIVVNAAVSVSSQTPGMNRCVVSILGIRESLIWAHSIRSLLFCT